MLVFSGRSKSISKEKTNAATESNSCHSAERLVIIPGIFCFVALTTFLSDLIGPDVRLEPPTAKDFPSRPTISISDPWRERVCFILSQETLGSSTSIDIVGFFAIDLLLLYFDVILSPNYFGPVADQLR